MANEPVDEKRDGGRPEASSPQPGKPRGKAKVEVKVELDLDDLEVFDLRGDGIKTVTVVSN